MSNFSDFISSGGGGLPVNIVLGHSQTWVPPVDGNICIHVVGAGGGGVGTDGLNRSGGGAGYAKKNSLAVTTSGSFTVIVGAGGAGSLSNATGGTGGMTSVSGTGLSAALRAFGGTGASSSVNGVGGLSDGGDVNNTGGAGGDSGGGAVGITGTGNAGGSSLLTDPYGGSCDSVGPESLIGHGYICGGKGGDLFYSQTNASASYGPMNYSPNGTGGFLAGGGTWYMNGSGVVTRCHGGHGGIGGGGGGCNNDYGDPYATGGHGGNGIVIIQYLPA
tara:strand:+ start:286 stop:1110 length:825 start_codon:yes stop_codon:yes gene_type:complete